MKFSSEDLALSSNAQFLNLHIEFLVTLDFIYEDMYPACSGEGPTCTELDVLRRLVNKALELNSGPQRQVGSKYKNFK